MQLITQKGSVCHSNDIGLVVWWLGVMAAILMVLCSTLTFSSCQLYFFQAYVLPLRVSVVRLASPLTLGLG